MDYFRLLSNTCKRNSLFLGTAVLLPLLLTSSCVPQELIEQDEEEDRAASEEGAQPEALEKEVPPKAMKVLPKTKMGDIDWVAALKKEIIRPFASLDATAEPAGSILNLDIVFNVSDAYPVPHVVFPHAPHTLWLNCNSCHPAIFIMKQGANLVSMDRIIKGEFCGRCHGVVAFPFTDCIRCHSRPKTSG